MLNERLAESIPFRKNGVEIVIVYYAPGAPNLDALVEALEKHNREGREVRFRRALALSTL